MLRVFLFGRGLLLVGCHSAPVESPKVKLGIDVLRDSNFAILAGKRVGLVAHPASVDSHLQSDVDLFTRQDRCKLVALFGPEHGFYGDEYGGDQVADRVDPGSGLPIYSLYGKTRVPTAEMAQNIDAFVFDLQDIGCRSYTFVGTMKSVTQRCAADDIELVTLDRPNPLGGNRIEGPGLDPKFTSFVKAHTHAVRARNDDGGAGADDPRPFVSAVQKAHDRKDAGMAPRDDLAGHRPVMGADQPAHSAGPRRSVLRRHGNHRRALGALQRRWLHPALRNCRRTWINGDKGRLRRGP